LRTIVPVNPLAHLETKVPVAPPEAVIIEPTGRPVMPVAVL
jgi:hypothetical protein